MRSIILHLQVPEYFVEVCMKEWEGNKPISKLKIAELYEKFIEQYIRYSEAEDFIKEELKTKQ